MNPTCWPLVAWICLHALKLTGQAASSHFGLKTKAFVSSSVSICNHCQTWSAMKIRIQKRKKKRKGLLPLPPAQFLADVSQLHSKSITGTFAEIMIKTLASCHFDRIKDILASFSHFFFFRYQLSKLHTTEWSAFVQAADIAGCQRADPHESAEVKVYT